MGRPATAPDREIIIPVFTQWEKVGSVTNILAELEQGIFYDAALLTDQFMRDDRLRASWDIAIQAVLGMPMHFEPADYRAKKKAQAISDSGFKLWPQMAPRPELIELLKWGFFLGAGIARKNWRRRSDGTWLPAIQTWHPGALRFDLTTDTYMLRTQNRGEIPILPDDPNWVLFTPFGHKYGRLNGYMRSIAMIVLERQWGHRDRARNSEKHGEPHTQLITPAELDQKDKDIARRATAALGSETVSITPQGQDGNRYDWKFHWPALSTSEIFGGTLSDLDDSIAILILGQRSSTKGSTGLGSDANPGDVVRRDKMRFYATCIADLGRDGILDDWADYNYGARDAAPTPCIEVDPPEDGQKKAQEMNTLGDALGKLERFGVDTRAILEEAGIPMLSAAEQAAKEEDNAEDEADGGIDEETEGDAGDGSAGEGDQ